MKGNVSTLEPITPNDLTLKFIRSECESEDHRYEVVGHPKLHIQLGCFDGLFGVVEEVEPGAFKFHPTTSTLSAAEDQCVELINAERSTK